MYHNTSFPIFCHSDTSTSSVQALGGIYLIIKRFFTSLRSVQNDKIPIMSDNGQSKVFYIYSSLKNIIPNSDLTFCLYPLFLLFFSLPIFFREINSFRKH